MPAGSSPRSTSTAVRWVSSMRSASRRPAVPWTVTSSRWPRARRSGTLEWIVKREPLARSKTSVTLYRPRHRPPAARSCPTDGRRPASARSSRRANAPSAPPEPSAAMRASAAASDKTVTIRSGAICTSSALRPGSCACAAAGRPNVRAAAMNAAALETSDARTLAVLTAWNRRK